MTAPGGTGLPRKLALLGALYFVQGLPFGFQATALPVYLRERGVSLGAIGWAGALAAPWALKVLWAPLVDRFWSPGLGRRRSWILPAQGALAAACLGAAFLPPEEGLSAFLVLVLLMNLFAATQDVAVDGLAVDLLRDREMGPGNAAQVVGYKVGMLTGGGLLLAVSADLGWPAVFLLMALLVSAVLLAVVLVRPDRSAAGGDGERPPATPPRLREIARDLGRGLRLPGVAWLLLVLATYKTGESMIDAMWKPLLVDAGLGSERIGLWVGTYGMAASLAGSAAGAFLARAVTVRRALVRAGVLRLLPVLAEWALATALPHAAPGAAARPPLEGPLADLVLATTVAEHFFGGVLTTVLFAAMMTHVAHAGREIGATHFTLLASVEVFGKSVLSLPSGQLADAFGYAAVFATGAALSLAWVAIAGLAPLPSSLAGAVTPPRAPPPRALDGSGPGPGSA